MPSREFGRISTQELSVFKEFLDQKPVPLGKIAKSLEIDVIVSSLPPGISGQISNANGKFEIRINRNESRERQRYTLAHELAHFLLHRDRISDGTTIKDNRLYRSGAPEQVEYEANRLAADLIMPEHMIARDVHRLNGFSLEDALEKLASEWQVSKSALEIRLSPYI